MYLYFYSRVGVRLKLIIFLLTRNLRCKYIRRIAKTKIISTNTASKYSSIPILPSNFTAETHLRHTHTYTHIKTQAQHPCMHIEVKNIVMGTVARLGLDGEARGRLGAENYITMGGRPRVGPPLKFWARPTLI